MDTNDSGTAANQQGKGSTYGGTQTPDPNVPDGYQKPQPGKDAENTRQVKDSDLGEEYTGDSSYGEGHKSPATAAGEKGKSADTDAGGSGV